MEIIHETYPLVTLFAKDTGNVKDDVSQCQVATGRPMDRPGEPLRRMVGATLAVALLPSPRPAPLLTRRRVDATTLTKIGIINVLVNLIAFALIERRRITAW